MLSIALTGNVASGKSRVAELFRRWGATVIDADQLVREIEAPGTPGFQAIVTEFGPEVVAPDGTLDRAALRACVFSHPDLRLKLEGIVHPAVATRRAALEEGARRRGARIVVNDIPLLFESLDPAAFDAVVLVDAPESLRLARLVGERRLAESEARQIMAAQWPAERKRAWRDASGRGAFIIENDGNLASLEQRARVVWDQLASRAGAGPGPGDP